jgi:hypothetical protein
MSEMKTTLVAITLAALGLGSVGCQFIARGEDQYRTDTAALLDTRSGEIKSCYDSALRNNKSLQGNVRVRFLVESESGVIKDAAVDPAGTTAPPELADCVINSIQGLALEPPDARDGDATFVWEFTVGPGGAA